MILEMDLKLQHLGEGKLALQAGIVLFVARRVLEAARVACAGIKLRTSTGRRLLAPCFGVWIQGNRLLRILIHIYTIRMKLHIKLLVYLYLQYTK